MNMHILDIWNSYKSVTMFVNAIPEFIRATIAFYGNCCILKRIFPVSAYKLYITNIGLHVRIFLFSYENTSFGASAGYCHSCQGPLTLHCKKCNAPSQQEYLIPLTWPFPGSGDLPLQSSPTSDSSASLDQDTVIEAGEMRTEIPKEEFDLHLPTMVCYINYVIR